MGGVAGGVDDTSSAEGLALEIEGVGEAVGVHNEQIIFLQGDFLEQVGILGVEAEEGAAFGEVDDLMFS